MSLDTSPNAKGQGDVHIVNPLEIDDWNRRLTRLPNATFFHTVAWARVLQSSYGYSPLYFLLGKPEHPQALLPVLEVNSWLTGRRGISLPFTDALEPLGIDAASFQRLFEAILAQASQRHWRYMEFRGGKKWLGTSTIATSYFSHHLTLTKDESLVFKGFSESSRRAVRKAEDSDLTVEFSQDLDSIRMFYSLYGQTRKRHGVPPQPFSFFARIQQYILSTQQGWVAIARKGQQPVAGAVFFHHDGVAHYKFGASEAGAQSLRANNLIIWRAIQWYARQGFHRMDFGRTSLGNEGLRRFKLGWGAQEETIDYFKYDLPKAMFVPAQDYSSGWHTESFKKLPLFLSRMIGQVLYRHIG